MFTIRKNTQSFMSVTDMISYSCHVHAEKKAYENMGKWMTYRQLSIRANALAYHFVHDLGLKRGDRVAIMLPNTLQHPICSYAALLAGLVVVPVNALYTVRELNFQLNDSGAKCLIVLDVMAHIAQQAIPDSMVEQVIVSKLGDCFPQPESFIVNMGMKYIKKMVPSYHLPHAGKLRGIMRKHYGKQLEKVAVKKDDLAFLQYTGGTTGKPKAAMLSHKNLLANIEQCRAGFINRGLDVGKETLLLPLPLYHIYATIISLISICEGDACVLVTNPRDIAGLIKTASRHDISVMVMINTLMVALMAHRKFKQLDFSALKATLTGGMATQHHVAARWQKLTGCMVDQGYGLSETSPVVTITALMEADKFLGHVGVAVNDTELRVIDDAGHTLPPGQQGELCVRGPQVMQGYWNNPQETHRILSADGWLRTGDIAAIGKDHAVHIVDRLKDMILVSGFNVYPNEIEEAIMEHESVLEAGVVGVIDGKGQEVVKAFVVKQSPDLTVSALREFCRGQLTGYKIPKRIEFVDSIPKTSVGKVLRRELRKAA